MPKVFIIILNWNGWSDTKECLESLEKVTYDNFEVILIDNASSEKFSIYNSQFTNLLITPIFNKENLGFAGGNNQGIKIALERGADYTLLLNNDTTVEPNFLTELVDAAENNKEFGIVGPIIHDYKNREKIQFAGGKINWSKTRGTHQIVMPDSIRHPDAVPAEAGIHWIPAGVYPKLDSRFRSPCRSHRRSAGGNDRFGAGMTENRVEQTDEIIRTDYITGCCLLIKREVIEKIGLLSEDYFLYYEDTDWNLRTQKAGWLCGVVRNARIYHKASQSAQEFSYPYIYYHSRNGLMFSARFGNKLLIYLISFWILAKQVIKLIIGYKKDWARPVMKGVVDFWKGKKGKLEGYY